MHRPAQVAKLDSNMLAIACKKITNSDDPRSLPHLAG
jgi:hypothetical protein